LTNPVSREVVLADGSSLLLLGGETNGGRTVATVRRLDPQGAREVSVGALSEPTHDAGGAWLRSNAFVFGGGNLTTTATVQTLGSKTSRLPQPRSDLATTTVGSEVVIAGGYDGAHLLPQVLETSDARTYRTIGMLARPVRYAGAAAIDRVVYVLGGTDGRTDTSDVQAIDAYTGRARIVAHLPIPVSHAVALAYRGAIFLFGGRTDGRASARVFRFDPATGRARVVGLLPFALSDSAAAVLGARAYLVGGETTHPLSTVIGCDLAS
jgi:Kelch motif protein